MKGNITRPDPITELKKPRLDLGFFNNPLISIVKFLEKLTYYVRSDSL
jgi:hypothetical protein